MKKMLAMYLKFRIKRIRKNEFSKKLCIFSIFVMLFTIVLSSVLSIKEKDTLSDISVAVITTCGGYLCTYGIKSAFEKNSRNKYGIDSDGIPFVNKQEQSEEEDEANG